MDHTMSNTKHTRPAILRSQPRCKSINGLTPVTNGNILVCKAFTAGIFDR